MTHETGVIGLPLRLLAREVYKKISDRVGESKVALVTGEEKIIPVEPRYWVSTVEAMPRDLDVDFVCVDEVQLATNLERGHVFTDRILNVRGKLETMLLGAGTIRGLLTNLLPGITIESRPRFSLITYAGSKKITRQPRRTAVVAFSANDVYAIAELIRRQRGGAAVVLGALSPRTRNAQVEIYQSGDVDFLVATDAIGMGLNLDVDHVAFAGRHKFDGFDYRELTAAEMGQISGRAGRHMRDGTFGVTGRTEPLDDYLVEKLETHSFETVRRLQWRNADLDFSSLETLRHSLDDIPDHPLLTRALPQEDAQTMEAVLRDRSMKDRANSQTRMRLLWDACQLPDYRKIAPAQHVEIVGQLFAHLADEGIVPEDWMEGNLKNTDRVDGDIDALSARIAHVRTWTFVANRNAWLKDPLHWQERTRALEDRLSDALHEKLTQRFVDRRTSVLMRRLREKEILDAIIAPNGDVQVEGQHVGWLAGFRFTPDSTTGDLDAKAVRGAAQKALAVEIQRRSEKVVLAEDKAFALDADGGVRWSGEVIAKLSAGDDILKPKLILLADEQLTGGARDGVSERLDRWLAAQIELHLGSLLALRTGEGLDGIARGLGFQLSENLGHIDRREVADQVKGLDQEARGTLRAQGVRFGAYSLFIPQLLKPAPATLLVTLWALNKGPGDIPGVRDVPQLNASGRTSVPVDPSFDKALYPICGFRICGTRAVRFDILERLADVIRPLIAFRPGVSEGEQPDGAADGNGFTVTVGMTSLLGCAGDDFSQVLKSLGYRVERKTVPIEAGDQNKSQGDTSGDATGEITASEPLVTVDVETENPVPPSDDASPPTSEEPSATQDTSATQDASMAEDPAAAPESMAAPSIDAAGAENVTEGEAPTEQIIEIWRPGGQRSSQRPRHRSQRHGKGSDNADRRPKGQKRQGQNRAQRKSGANSNKRYESSGPKKERGPDPDSPFAALAGLLDKKDGDG